MNELGALAGIEKSGHFVFNEPIRRTCDDGLITAIAVLEMLDRNPGTSMADLYRRLPDSSTGRCRSPGARRPCPHIVPTT